MTLKGYSQTVLAQKKRGHKMLRVIKATLYDYLLRIWGSSACTIVDYL